MPDQPDPIQNRLDALDQRLDQLDRQSHAIRRAQSSIKLHTYLICILYALFLSPIAIILLQEAGLFKGILAGAIILTITVILAILLGFTLAWLINTYFRKSFLPDHKC